MIGAALLLAAATPVAQPYPADAVLAAFRKGCNDTRKFKALEKALPKQGWTMLAEGEASRVDKLVAKGKASLEADEKIEGHHYRRTVAGRELYLITSRVTDESGIWASGCRVYDFEADNPIRDEILVRWMKKPPTHKEEMPNGGVVRKWEPGWRSGVGVDVDFAGHGGDFNEEFGLSGVVLIASSIGGF
ncbi:hypothetical protein [Sphingorhabdus sp.]|jgi:hypothetical protein|uniref:hypothetical protein n=1 Tax=Sphingorhabdus sp. TaxID=1902408 RepID=UPI003BB01987|nr:hypothetical protein [Sphingomonadales bacterium]MBK9432125.1 hypothetical protein [Sphingomonadales bacterium]MBL0023348.1 hypothetical protein [Sphingomonadales bacterium]